MRASHRGAGYYWPLFDMRERFSELLHRRLTDLRDSRERHTHDFRNLLHRELFAIIEGETHRFPLGELRDGFREMGLHLSLQAKVEGIGIVQIWRGLDHVQRLGAVIGRS